MQIDVHAAHFSDEFTQPVGGVLAADVHDFCVHTSGSEHLEPLQQFGPSSGDAHRPSVADVLQGRLAADA